MPYFNLFVMTLNIFAAAISKNSFFFWTNILFAVLNGISAWSQLNATTKPPSNF